MALASYRKSLGLSQEQVAVALGLSETSKGYISALERGSHAPLQLALKIEEWSGGRVQAKGLVDAADAQLLATHVRLSTPATAEA